MERDRKKERESGRGREYSNFKVSIVSTIQNNQEVVDIKHGLMHCECVYGFIALYTVIVRWYSPCFKSVCVLRQLSLTPGC